MEQFIVSARKYRPDTFHSVVGQKTITLTLKNAIRNKHLAHGYLFCGPRGVGKTTCARIFAKTLNCLQVTSDYEPCNQCESCQAFNDGRSYNIHELDAASNNSVEDIRSLIDQVRIPPQIGKYSVYIIDEAHMLSTQAFNAFLKTLEEPPAHAVFILATTEKHKIIPTILSRCQKFDFNRIRVEDAVEHLAYVARCENIEADPDGLNVIAQKADGAMRDALSYFDQIVSFAGGKFSYRDVIDNLHVLDYDYYFRLTDAFLQGDYKTSLVIFNDILSNGFDGHHFIAGLSSHFRDVLVCTDDVTLELLEVGANIKERYKQQARQCSPAFLLRALSFTNACDNAYKQSSNQRLHVELCLLQLCNIVQSELNAPPVQQVASNTSTTTTNKTTTNNTIAPTTTTQTEPNKAKLFSIKDALKGNTTTPPATNTVTPPPTQQVVQEPSANYNTSETQASFDADSLKQKWLEFSKTLNSTRLASTFSNHLPQIKENNLVEVSLSNSSQEKELLNIKADLLQFLRRHLNNSSIEVTFKVDEKNVQRKAFTTDEKLQQLNERNPELQNMIKKFNLGF